MSSSYVVPYYTTVISGMTIVCFRGSFKHHLKVLVFVSVEYVGADFGISMLKHEQYATAKQTEISSPLNLGFGCKMMG